MTLNTDSLFNPIELGPLKLQNRIVMAPMTRAYSPGNVPNSKNIAYYERRAQGGVGLIITEGTCVGHKAASGYPNVPFFYGDDALAGWKKVVEKVHAAGGKIIPQLWHVGAVRREGMEPDPSVPGYGPSGLIAKGKKRCHEMTKDDIADVIEAFAQAAKDAQDLGFDGVEIHGAHGYLIDQFFWEDLNERTDEYGGDMVGRTRFAVDIIKAVRERVGPDFPIFLRWSQWKQQDYDAKLAGSPEKLAAFLQPLVDAGVDVFHCSTRRFWEPEFEGSDLNLAGWVKKLTGKPTVTVGSVSLDTAFTDPGAQGFASGNAVGIDDLVKRMDAGEFDMVAVGRALIANPDWPELIRTGNEDKLVAYDKDMLMELV